MQQTQIWSLIQKDPTCLGATTEPASWALTLAATKARTSRAGALQQEKSPQQDACTPPLEKDSSSTQHSQK